MPCMCSEERSVLSMQQTHNETHATNNEQQQAPSTGQVAKKARLEAVLPTALMGPAQQGREPYPIILPHITIGVSVAPHVPALPAVRASAGAPLAIEHRATLVLTPLTNEGQREETGTHEQRLAAQEPIAPPPPAAPGHKSGYPVITTPIPTPSDVSHTPPFPSSPAHHQAQQWSPRHRRLFLAGLGSGLFLYLLALALVAVFIAPVVTLAATVTLGTRGKDALDYPHRHSSYDRHA